MNPKMILLNSISIFCCLVTITWANSDSINLRKIEALTLRQGVMTTGRRSPSVPQLKCVGGTAGCETVVPQVIQCLNSRGSDGFMIQWECKTEMPNAFKFGNINIYCEGFSHPEDPNVLKGSCGLEYSIDFTMEGPQQYHKNSEPIKSTKIEAVSTTQILMTSNTEQSSPSVPQLDFTIVGQHHQNLEKSDTKKKKNDGYSCLAIVGIAVGTFTSFLVLGLAIYAIITRPISMLFLSGAGHSTGGNSNGPNIYVRHQPRPRLTVVPLEVYHLDDESPQQQHHDSNGENKKSPMFLVD